MSGRLFIPLGLVEGKRAGNVQLNAALIFAAVFSGRCFYCEGPKNSGVLSRCAPKRWVGGSSSVAFFSYESGKGVINSSVTFNHELVSSALTGISLECISLEI